MPSRARSGARSWRHFGLALSPSRRENPSVPKDDHQQPGKRRLAPRTNVMFSKGEAHKISAFNLNYVDEIHLI